VQWPPPTKVAYQFLRLFKFRLQRAWDDDAKVADVAVGRVMPPGGHPQLPPHPPRWHRKAAAEENCDVLVQSR